MLASLTATESAFLMAATMQAMAALLWAIVAWAVAETRRPAAHWSLYAALSSFAWVNLALQVASPPMVAVAAGVLAAAALQRGIRIFIDRPPRAGVALAMLAAVVAAHFAFDDPRAQHLQAAVNFGALALVYAGTAIDLFRHARDALKLRWPVLLVLPVGLGVVGYGSRALRALLVPASVAAEMATHSALNVASAIAFIVLVLAMHAMLLALVVSRLVVALRRASRHDALTGVLNRRAIEEALAAEVRRARRFGEPFSVLMLDADRFKAINDAEGHAAGDRALQHLATLLGAQLRDIDRVGRWGGEEFLVLLPGTRRDDAAQLAERLRERAEALPPHWQDRPLRLTLSIGVAQWGDADDVEPLVARADAALYRAKDAGRNRVELETLPLAAVA